MIKRFNNNDNFLFVKRNITMATVEVVVEDIVEAEV